MLCQPFHLLRGSVVGMGRGMQGRTEADLPFLQQRLQSHVLYQQRIHSGLAELLAQREGVAHLLVIDDGIDRSIDFGIIAVSIAAELGNVLNAIACSGAGSVFPCTDIHSIGTVVYGADTAFKVLCRGKEF
jgi:hypothetical protein